MLILLNALEDHEKVIIVLFFFSRLELRFQAGKEQAQIKKLLSTAVKQLPEHM